MLTNNAQPIFGFEFKFLAFNQLFVNVADAPGLLATETLVLATAILPFKNKIQAPAAICLFFHYLTGGVFLSARNFSNLMLQTSVTGVLAVGMLMVIITGQIDLSVGSGRADRRHLCGCFDMVDS